MFSWPLLRHVTFLQVQTVDNSEQEYYSDYNIIAAHLCVCVCVFLFLFVFFFFFFFARITL